MRGGAVTRPRSRRCGERRTAMRTPGYGRDLHASLSILTLAAALVAGCAAIEREDVE